MDRPLKEAKREQRGHLKHADGKKRGENGCQTRNMGSTFGGGARRFNDSPYPCGEVATPIFRDETMSTLDDVDALHETSDEELDPVISIAGSKLSPPELLSSHSNPTIPEPDDASFTLSQSTDTLDRTIDVGESKVHTSLTDPSETPTEDTGHFLGESPKVNMLSNLPDATEKPTSKPTVWRFYEPEPEEESEGDPANEDCVLEQCVTEQVDQMLWSFYKPMALKQETRRVEYCKRSRFWLWEEESLGMQI